MQKRQKYGKHLKYILLVLSILFLLVIVYIFSLFATPQDQISNTSQKSLYAFDDDYTFLGEVKDKLYFNNGDRGIVYDSQNFSEIENLTVYSSEKNVPLEKMMVEYKGRYYALIRDKYAYVFSVFENDRWTPIYRLENSVVTGMEVYKDKIYVSVEHSVYGKNFVYDGKNITEFSVCPDEGGVNNIEVFDGYLYALVRGCSEELCRFNGTGWECFQKIEGAWSDKLVELEDELIISRGSLEVLSFKNGELRTVLKPKSGYIPLYNFEVHEGALYMFDSNRGNTVSIYNHGDMSEIELPKEVFSIDELISYDGDLYALAKVAPEKVNTQANYTAELVQKFYFISN